VDQLSGKLVNIENQSCLYPIERGRSRDDLYRAFESNDVKIVDLSGKNLNLGICV
jgi:hypothetical protein